MPSHSSSNSSSNSINHNNNGNNSGQNSSNNTVDYCDRLAAYELNLLETDERLEFENHLPHCSDCLEEMYSMAPAMSQLTAQPGRYAAQAARYLEQDKTETWLTRLNKILFSGPARVLVPVAVAAVLAMLIFMPQTTDIKYRSLAMTEAPAFSPIQVRAGQQDQWLPLWDSGMQAYRTGQYDVAVVDLTQAINLIAKLPNSAEERFAVLDNARLYLGVSQMLSDQTDDALVTLKVAATSTLRPVQQKSLWYLAQVHLLNEQPEEALTVLSQLENSLVYGPRAKALTVEIKKLN